MLAVASVATGALGGADAYAKQRPSSGGAGMGGSGSHAKTAKSSKRSSSAPNGGAAANGPSYSSTPSHPTVPGDKAKIVNGLAYAPADAPLAVQRAIWAGDAIRHKPYVWGGGHGSWNDSGYDCSGSVSFVLHAGGLLSTPMASGDLMSWGVGGVGQWITVYTNSGHAFVEIAGIRLDTSAEGDPHPAPGSGPRWRPLLRDTGGFMARHPRSL